MAKRVVTLDDLARQFGDFSIRVSDVRPAMRVGGIMGLGEVKDRFDTGKDPEGMPWKPLRFPRVQGGNLPMRNTGLLAASYVSEYGRDYWKVGTNLKYARMQHYGATIVPVKKRWLTIPMTKQAVYSG